MRGGINPERQSRVEVKLFSELTADEMGDYLPFTHRWHMRVPEIVVMDQDHDLNETDPFLMVKHRPKRERHYGRVHESGMTLTIVELGGIWDPGVIGLHALGYSDNATELAYGARQNNNAREFAIDVSRPDRECLLVLRDMLKELGLTGGNAARAALLLRPHFYRKLTDWRAFWAKQRAEDIQSTGITDIPKIAA